MLEDKLFNHFNKDELLYLICNDDDRFKIMVEIATSNPRPLSWKAAWLLSQCVEENDPRIKPFLKDFVDAIDHKKDGYQRELLKIISRMEIPEELEGIVFDKCASIWESPKKSPSVRIIAFKVMIKVAEKYPELKNEIKLYTQDHYIKTLSPGIQRSVQKLLNSH